MTSADGGAAGEQATAVDVDAAAVFRHPYAVVLVLTAVAGAVDAVAFEWFGVFTSNQAGNLVVVWTLLPTDPAAALLSAASVVGCGFGVATVALLRRRFAFLATPRGARTLLVAAAGLIVVAAIVSVRVTAPAGGQPAAPVLGAAAWWASAVSVTVAAASLAAMAVVVVSAHGTRAAILAPTNSLVEAVRLGTASRWRPSPARSRALRAGGFPIAWTCGAASAALLPVGYVGIAVAAGVTLLVIALAVPPARPAT